MLACSYLSAKKLGLKVKERDALIDILEKLERGVFIHEQPGGEFDYNVGLAFSMSKWIADTGCIAGWCDVLHGTQFTGRFSEGDFWRPSRARNLQDLFHIDDSSGRSLDGVEGPANDDITPRQAAAALRNYLTTGKPHWNVVFAPKPVREQDHGREVDAEGEREDGEEGHQGRVASLVGCA